MENKFLAKIKRDERLKPDPTKRPTKYVKTVIEKQTKEIVYAVCMCTGYDDAIVYTIRECTPAVHPMEKS